MSPFSNEIISVPPDVSARAGRGGKGAGRRCLKRASGGFAGDLCDPDSALRLAGLYLAGLDRLGVRRAGGAAYEGILLASQTALLSALRDGPRVEGFYCRDSAKSHGAGGTLEGRVPGRGDDAALLAGFVCDGAPLPEAARLVRETGARVACFLVLGLCGECGVDAASWGAPVYLVGGADGAGG